MKIQTFKYEGVVSEYKGEYWGDGKYESREFGGINNAKISSPEYCLVPTDMTYDPENTNGYNPDYDKLKNAKLVKVIKTVTYEIGE